jgi:hypothetical protein
MIDSKRNSIRLLVRISGAHLEGDLGWYDTRTFQMVNTLDRPLTGGETMLSYFLNSGQSRSALVDVPHENILEGLHSHVIQDYITEAEAKLQNGGPRGDQNYRFSCDQAEQFPLHFAAMMGDVKKIHRLVNESKIDPNTACPHWFDVQPIWFAACYGHLHATLALLKVRLCFQVPHFLSAHKNCALSLSA